MTGEPGPAHRRDGRPALRIVVPRYGEGVVGGSETLARRLSRALVERAWRVEVLTTTAVDEATWRNALPAGEAVEESVLVHRFRTALPRLPWAFHQLSRAVFRLPAAVRPETAWVLAQGPVAPGLVRRLRVGPPLPTLFIPYLFHPTVRGIAVAPPPRLLIPAGHEERPFHLRMAGRTIARADALLYSTPEERVLVESIHPVAARRPAAVGSVGVEPPAVDPSAFRRRHGLRAPYLLYGGRAGRSKSFDTLLAGMRELRRARPDAVLVLMGEAGEVTPPEEGLLLVGRLSDRERWEAIAGAAAAVAPSALESLSLLVLEAWAVGRPCLVNGESPVLTGQAERSRGALCFRGPGELAAAAGRILADPTLGSRLGTSGRDYVERHYRWDEVADRIAGLIDEVRPPAASGRLGAAGR